MSRGYIRTCPPCVWLSTGDSHLDILGQIWQVDDVNNWGVMSEATLPSSQILANMTGANLLGVAASVDKHLAWAEMAENDWIATNKIYFNKLSSHHDDFMAAAGSKL